MQTLSCEERKDLCSGGAAAGIELRDHFAKVLSSAANIARAAFVSQSSWHSAGRCGRYQLVETVNCSRAEVAGIIQTAQNAKRPQFRANNDP